MTHDFKRVLDRMDNGKAIDALEWLDANLPTIRHALAFAETAKQKLITADGWEDGETFYRSTVEALREEMFGENEVMLEQAKKEIADGGV